MTARPAALILALCIGSFALQGCEEDTAINTEADKPVVEAYLRPNQPVQVRISRQIPTGSSGTSDFGIADLDVQVQEGTVSYALNHLGNGVYRAPSDLVPQSGKTYRLSFLYLGVEVYAETTIPERPVGFDLSATAITVPNPNGGGGGFGGGPPEPVEATWENPNREYHVLTLTPVDASPRRINDDDDDEDDDQGVPNSLGSPTREASTNINAMQLTYYGRHAAVLSRVQPEYAALFQSSGNQQTLRSPSTNVVNGYGIFTGVASDTLYLRVR